MKLRTAFCAAGLLLVSSINPVFSADNGFIKPGTPEAAQAIAKLTRAATRQSDECAAPLEAGEDSEAGTYYYKKAKAGVRR